MNRLERPDAPRSLGIIDTEAPVPPSPLGENHASPALPTRTWTLEDALRRAWNGARFSMARAMESTRNRPLRSQR